MHAQFSREPKEKDLEELANVMRSLRRERFPKHPTRGAMMSELERIGITVRGLPLHKKDGYTDEQLANMLKAEGYDVEASPAPNDKEEQAR